MTTSETATGAVPRLFALIRALADAPSEGGARHPTRQERRA